MHHAASEQFARIVAEYVRWRAVPDEDRSPAPGWWWGPAFEVLGVDQPMPAEWCASLGLPDGASHADGARTFLGALADQKFLPWPGDFPGRPGNPEPA